MGKRIIQKTPKEKRVTTRKIGNGTYIVSSSFKEGKERDIVSTISRLIQNEKPKKTGA
jgi:hypothetical protein